MVTTAPKGKALLAKAILALLVLGALSYGYLPQAACDLETDEDGNPKIVRYIYMSDSKKTVTKVLPSSDEGGYSIIDDRCQRGTEIGEWRPLKEISQPKCPWAIGYVTNCETGKTDKYLCKGIGQDVPCNRADEISMPFE